MRTRTRYLVAEGPGSAWTGACPRHHHPRGLDYDPDHQGHPHIEPVVHADGRHLKWRRTVSSAPVGADGGSALVRLDVHVRAPMLEVRKVSS